MEVFKYFNVSGELQLNLHTHEGGKYIGFMCLLVQKMQFLLHLNFTFQVSRQKTNKAVKTKSKHLFSTRNIKTSISRTAKWAVHKSVVERFIFYVCADGVLQRRKQKVQFKKFTMQEDALLVRRGGKDKKS